MKVLLAKRPSPPRQRSDIWSAMNGEIVVAPFVCNDDGCDCDHVHQGIVSHGYSTQAEVSEVATSPDGLVLACRSHLDFSQWAAIVDNPAELDMLAADLIDAMGETANHHPIGTVLRMMFDHRASRWRYTTVT
ncbi:DUF7715 family protein [Mycolicibacterium sarraceniae]|nr:hypothetical protein [Mycolicibacterium sarraceniae]